MAVSPDRASKEQLMGSLSLRRLYLLLSTGGCHCLKLAVPLVGHDDIVRCRPPGHCLHPEPNGPERCRSHGAVTWGPPRDSRMICFKLPLLSMGSKQSRCAYSGNEQDKMVQQHGKITVKDHHLQPHGMRHQVGPSLTSVHPKEPKQHQLVGRVTIRL